MCSENEDIVKTQSVVRMTTERASRACGVGFHGGRRHTKLSQRNGNGIMKGHMC